MVVRQNTKQIFVTILVSAKTVISRGQPANQNAVFPARGELWTNERRGQMADDHLLWFIYFYFLFMSESNHCSGCHMVIVWEEDREILGGYQHSYYYLTPYSLTPYTLHLTVINMFVNNTILPNTSNQSPLYNS